MHYQSGIEHAKEHLSQSILLAFNTNVDAVKHLSGEDLEGMELPSVVADLADHMTRGVQKEVAVSEDDLKYLMDKLGVDEYRIGGQVGNMARDAARLGVKAYSHVAKKCKNQMDLFDSGDVMVATEDGFIGSSKITTECTPAVHYVMEFKKDDTVGGKKIPSSNRYIASYDPETFAMDLDPLFLEHSKTQIREINKGIISGFHLVEEDHAHKIREFGEIIDIWKKKNPGFFLHLEMAEFQSMAVMDEVMDHLLPRADSVGANEVELEMMTGIEDRDEGLRILADEVDMVLYHSSTYSACISNAPQEKVIYSLEFATLMGAYKAAHGRGPTMKELEAYEPEDPSEEGLAVKIEMEPKDYGKPIVVVPSLHVDNPKSLVGVGDCFTASFVLSI